VYNTAGQLTSATNPENGTVSYSYNSDTTLYSKTDAKGQVTVYTYDGTKRPTMVQIYPSGLSYSEDICQRVTYSYGTAAPEYGQLTSVQYGAPYSAYMTTTCSATPGPTAYSEYYSHNSAGGVTTKQFAISRPYPLSGGWTSTAYVNLNYTYSSAGQQATMQQITSTYGTEVTYTTSYDSMGRPLGMTDDSSNTWTQNAAYDAAGRRTSLQMLAAPSGSPYYQTEANTFNVNGQLTEIQWSAYTGTSNVQYGYSGTANNGQITSMTYSSGEVVSYSY
jgi:YD repeat-containing protein